MILQVIYTVFTSSQWAHAHIVQKPILTPLGCPFHPSSRATGYSRTIFYKVRIFQNGLIRKITKRRVLPPPTTKDLSKVETTDNSKKKYA